MSDTPLHSVVFERPLDIPGRRSTQACVACCEVNRPQWAVVFCPQLGCVRITYKPIDGTEPLAALIPLARVCAMHLPMAPPLSFEAALPPEKKPRGRK